MESNEAGGAGRAGILVRTYSALLRYGSPSASAEDLASFEEHADAISEDVLRYFVPLLAVIALLFWPTDTLLYADPRIQRGLTAWRFGQIGILVAAYVASRVSRLVRDHARAAIIVTGLVSFAFSARAATGIESGATFAALLVLAPFAFTVVVVDASRRAWLLAGLGLVTLASAYHANPAFPLFRLFAASMIAASMVAFVIGHAIFYLLFRNFFQQRAIERTAERLAEVDRMKSEFFANVSHELRTPLTLILGSLRAIARAPTPDAAAEPIDTASRNARRLLLLVNEILELARVAGEQGPRATKAVDVAAMLRRIVGDFDSAGGGRRSIELAGATAPVILAGDPERLRKVFYNLLSNAVKFTSEATGSIRVDLAETEREIVVRVTDDGIGIPEEDLDRIFERFVQLERGEARRYEGTGIGLALVKGIVTQAGGTVVAKSVLGAGSTFTVTLPRGQPTAAPGLAAGDREPEGEDAAPDLDPPRSEDPPAPEPGDDAGDRPRVLVVEDNADLRRYTTALLAPRYRVRTAPDGAAGLDLARTWRPDLVVTDVMMPVMSGVELLRALRGDEALRDTPVVFLTARAGMEDRSEALEGGADDYVAKPFGERELVARLENLLLRSRQARSLAAMNAELEARVLARTSELRALAEHLADALERERARIAREIHDDFGQTLAAMRLEVDLAARGLAEDGERAETMRRLSRLLEATLTSARRILAELRPQGLDELGLLAAVEQLAGDFRARNGAACDLSLDPDFDADPKRTTALFRIIQECLNNVGKHAAAKRVEVTLTVDGDLIRLAVRDDGRGLPAGAPRAGAMGLVGMRERALQFGGRVTVASAPGGGTTVDVAIPTAGVTAGES